MSDAALFSKTPPTEPGWYFVKHSMLAAVTIKEAEILEGTRVWYSLGREGCELSGPAWLYGPRIDLPSAPPTPPLELAIAFHEAYERLAPQFGYETRKDTRAFDPESANGRLMIAVCDEVMKGLGCYPQAAAFEWKERSDE